MMTKEQFLSFKQNHPLDSIAAAQLRDQSFETYIEAGLPTKKDEAWKYTSLSHLKETLFEIPQVENVLTHDEMKWIAGQLDRRHVNIVFTNGFFNRTLSDDIDFFDIVDLSVEDFKDFAETERKVTALSQAFSHRKYVLDLKKENQPEQVIKLSFFQTSLQPCYVNPITEIRVAENATTQIIVSYQSRGQKNHLLSSHVRVHLGRHANLQFLQLQDEELTDTHLSQVLFDLEDFAHLTTLDVASGGSLSRHFMQVNFKGEHATAGVYGVIALAQKQHSDHYTYINHIKGLNQSIQKYKSILAHQSNSIFRGRIRIEKNAQKAVSEQLNNSLMLSREANVSSIPQLEIYADDVKAGHGSTVGQLNKEEMFYFLSRGIDQIQATKMMAYGFVLEMTEVFESDKMREQVARALNQKLDGMFV